MNKRALKYAIPLAAIAATGFDEPADAGDLFLKIEPIPGESVDEVHEGEIDVLAWSWGVTTEPPALGGGGGGASVPSFTGLKIIKSFDVATPALILSAAQGGHLDNAILSVTRPDESGMPFDYLTITMDNVLVTKVAHGGKNSENGVAETITLNFERIKFEYKLQDSKGTTTTESCFDLLQNQKC